MLGLIESALYGAWTGVVYATLHNYFQRRADRDIELRVTIARAA